MDQETLLGFEGLCTQEEPPACQSMCPLHLEARTLATQLAAGKTHEARRTLERYMPLPLLGGRLCEGPCLKHCLRCGLDQAVDLPLLERFCLEQGRAPALMPLPPSGKKAALLGGELSSLAAAWELAKKGHQVTLFHPGPLGASLRTLPAGRLPEGALDEALEQLAALKVSFQGLGRASPALLNDIQAEYRVLFLGLDDPLLRPEALGLQAEELRREAIDAVTLETRRKNIFLGQAAQEQPFITALSAAKRAAASIDRVLAGAAASAAREKEAVRASALHVDLTDEPSKPRLVPVDPWKPSLEEAGNEAGRCLNCRCLECVKRCAFLRHYQGYPKKYAREIYNNIITAFGIRKSNILINSCAECGLCGEICPNGADLGAFCAQAREKMVADCHMPVSAHEFALEDMLFANAPEVSFLRPQPGLAHGRWLFFPGCQLPASMPEAVSSLYAHLGLHLPGGAGIFFSCCGAPARWSGRPTLTAGVSAGIRQAWLEAGQPVFILACASCRLFFQAELPEIEIRSLWSLLAELPPPPAQKAASQPLALHDPCAARHDAEAQAGVRAILARLGQEVEEPLLSGRLTRCCGYGALADQANPALGALYALDRAADTSRPIVAYCAMCRDRLRAVGHPSAHLLDLLFPSSSFREALERPAPDISRRQEARLSFRRGLLNTLWGEPPGEVAVSETDLEIPEEILPYLDAERILRSDIAAVLEHAAAHGPLFVNPENGLCLAALRPRQVTFWVEYEEKPDGKRCVRRAWRHRMLAPGVPGEGRGSPASEEGFAAAGGRV